MSEDDIRRHINQASQPRTPKSPVRAVRRASGKQATFDKFSATHLMCPRCRKANPVREKLLLFLPDGNLYDYQCTVCGSSAGRRKG